jgi:hypothetical protein
LRFLKLPSLWNFWTIEYHHALYWKYGTLAGLGRPLAQVTMDSELITILALRPFKWDLISSIWTTGTRVMLVKVYFFGKCPGQGQIPGLVSHGPQIPDRTINHCKATDLCSKFQLSKCYSGWEIGDRRTDGRHNDFSRAHFYKPFYVFDRFMLIKIYISLFEAIPCFDHISGSKQPIPTYLSLLERPWPVE